MTEAIDTGAVAITGGTSYASLASLKTRLGISDTTNDTVLETLLEEASRSIDDDTGRVFFTTTEARYFDGSGNDILLLDDFVSVSDVLEYDSEGALLNIWAAGAGEEYGYIPWPYNGDIKMQLRAVPDYTFTEGQRNFKITATWGIATVPTQIERACLERAVTGWNRLSTGLVTIESEGLGEYRYKLFTPQNMRETQLMQVAAWRRITVV